SKFASVNVFNGSNKQKDISLYAGFNSLCAFTQEELASNFGEELNELAKANNMPYETFIRLFAKKYSGYCFCKNGEKLYNPFSVLNALSSQDMLSFWFQTGVPSMLIKILQNSKFDFFGILEGICVDADTIMDYKWTEDDLVSVIFQSGYLTIRAYDKDNNLFELGLPNGEVRDGFLKNLLPYYTSVGTTSKYGAEIALIKACLTNGDVSGFVARYRESVKNVQLIQRKKEDAETVYLIAFHSLLMLTGFVFYSGSSLSGNHNDIVLEAGKHAYIFEIKMDKGIALEDVEADAFARIEEKKFAAKYAGTDISVHKVAIVFSSSKNELIGWKENNGTVSNAKEGV
nr:ATP-binding protein [Treponema sp.]